MTRFVDAVRDTVRASTALGRVVAVGGAVAWVLAWWTGWEELAVVAAMLLVATILAAASALGRSEFEIDLQLRPQRLEAGDTADGSLVARNVGGRRSLAVTVELSVGNNAEAFRVPSLPDLGEHDELFSVPTSRRSIIRVGPAATVRGDPVGLVRRERTAPATIDLFVHPVTTPLDRLGSGFLRDLEGQTTQDLSPSDVAFHTLREYVPGDDRRHIHWKTTARVGTLMVRQFVDTRRSFLAVLLPTDPATYADDDEFELGVSMASSIGVRALQDDQTVRFIAGDRLVSGPTPTGLLDAVAGVEHDPVRGRLAESVALANRTSVDASIVVVVAGSRVDIADVRSTLSGLKADAKILVFRPDAGAPAEARTMGDLDVVRAPTLDDFAQALFRIGLG